MAHQLIRLKVQEFNAWKQVFAELNEEREKLGQLSYQLYQDQADPNSITLIQEWENIEDAKAFYTSDAFKNAAHRAGNIGPADITVMTLHENTATVG